MPHFDLTSEDDEGIAGIHEPDATQADQDDEDDDADELGKGPLPKADLQMTLPPLQNQG